MTLNEDITKLAAESMDRLIFEAMGIPHKSSQKQSHTTQSHDTSGNVTRLPDDPQERWNQHMDRFKRGKRLTGYGLEIDEETRP